MPFGWQCASGAGKKQEIGKEGRRAAEKLPKPVGTCDGTASLLVWLLTELFQHLSFPRSVKAHFEIPLASWVQGSSLCTHRT